MRLTLLNRRRKSNGKVFAIPLDLYVRWRTPDLTRSALEETGDEPAVTEKLLHWIWHYQRLQRDGLRTLDGRAVRVLHPGFWSHEGGPDFRDAVLQFDTARAASGDVEIDLHPHLWRSHHHDQNPAYLKVILQVVWDGEVKPGRGLPVLALKPYLDAPLAEVKAWLGRDPLVHFSSSLAGLCCAPLRELPGSVVHEILRQAAQVRLQTKAESFRARARQIGWERSLWEGLFAALGYKNNVWPMRRVAELLPVLLPPNTSASPLLLQARLLGLSGLLPSELNGALADTGQYLRGVWDLWWREREAYIELVLPRTLWRFHGLRPANHPQRRLALAAHWLARGDVVARLEQWFVSSFSDRALVSSLLEVLQVTHDDYWSSHWTFRSKSLAEPQPLLGPQRVTDLAVNVLLPWLWMRAVAGKNEALQKLAEHRYFAWPPAEDNAVLRLARERLFGGKTGEKLRTAAAQQGILQIVHDFCDHSNALCENCPFPELVRELKP